MSRESKTMKKNLNLITLAGTLLLITNSANAISVYDNNISALNINTLTDSFISFAHYGEKTSDLFALSDIYGKMDRIDEYGDDGSTVKGKKTNGSVFDNIWIDANHLNADMHYGQGVSKHVNFNLGAFGLKTKAIDLKYGDLAFGGFASYINIQMPKSHSGGSAVGIFANYNYRNIALIALADTGFLNTKSHSEDFDNKWSNFAADLSVTFKIDTSFLLRPSVYISQTYVSSSDLLINDEIISSKDFRFLNVTPKISLIKEIADKWYATLSVKNVAHVMNGKEDIKVAADMWIEGLYLDNHTDIGLDIEHNFKHFIIGANVHKQFNGVDGLSGNINIKYAF